MKSFKFLFIASLLIIAAQSFAQGRYISQTQYVYTRPVYRQEVVHERVVVREQKEEKDNSQVGLLIRGGYSYNDDAVTYGASVYYHFKGILGISVGFDGYYIPNLTMYNEAGECVAYDGPHKNFPMWDMRAGFMLGKYFAFGGILGKCQLCKTESIHEKRDMWKIKGIHNGGIYGGYITFILPITENFGMNMDFAMTNHTGFNVGLGFNLYMDIKSKK